MRIYSYKFDIPNCDWIVPIDDPKSPKLHFSNSYLVSVQKLPEFDGVQIIFADTESDCFREKVHYRMPKGDIPDIVCEVIRLYQAVHTFGDSHSIVSYKIPICRENWLGFNSSLPLTMNRIGREGLDLHEAIKTINNGHEKYPIRRGDWVMYFYGEIDARYLILKQYYGKCKTGDEVWTGNINLLPVRPVSQIIDELIEGYMKTIKQNQERFGCRSIIYGIQPPAAVTAGANMFTGNLEERLEVWKELTKKLYERCKMEGVAIVDMAPHISGSDGLIRPEMLKEHGDIHLHLKYYYLVRDELMRVLTRPEQFGFIVPTCLREQSHIDTLNRCIKSIRVHHPKVTIVIIRDFSSTLDIAYDDPYIIIERNTRPTPADMLAYDYLMKKFYFEKAIVVQDSMEVLSPFDVAQVNTVSYLWYFTNHRTQWSVIQEPDTEYNRNNGIKVHDDLVRHCIGKIEDEKFRNYLITTYPKKSEWVGCFGCLTVMSRDFLSTLDQKTGIIKFMYGMSDNRLRRAIESIFSLACQYVLERIPDTYDGLYFDGVTGNGSCSAHIRKYSFNRQ